MELLPREHLMPFQIRIQASSHLTLWQPQLFHYIFGINIALYSLFCLVVHIDIDLHQLCLCLRCSLCTQHYWKIDCMECELQTDFVHVIFEKKT